MKKCSKYLDLFKNDSFETADVTEAVIECEKIESIKENSVYEITKISPKNGINVCKELNKNFMNMNKYTLVYDALKFTKHPCIKTPISHSPDKEGETARIFYNITEKGTLQAVLDFFEKQGNGDNPKFSWDLGETKENSDYTDFSLTLDQKVKILIGIASALYYISNTTKQQTNRMTTLLPSSVLLDDNFEPLIINNEITNLVDAGNACDAFFTCKETAQEKKNELVYSFGIIAYWLLSERRPFYYKDINTAKEKLQCGQIPLFPGRFPPLLTKVLTKCCSIKETIRPSFDIILCALINTFKTPEITAYANKVVDKQIIAAIRAANLGTDSAIYNILEETKTKAEASASLIKCANIAMRNPVCDRFLSFSFFDVAARNKSSKARKSVFLEIVNGYFAKADPEAAFKLVKKWSDEGDLESSVILAKCYKDGIGCQIDKDAYSALIKKAHENHVLSGSYEYGRFVGASTGDTIIKDAIRDSSIDILNDYLSFLVKSPFRDESNIDEILKEVPGKNAASYKLLIDNQIQKCPDGEEELASLLMLCLDLEYEKKEYTEAAQLLKLLCERGKDRHGNPTDIFKAAMAEEVKSMVDSIPICETESIRRKMSSSIVDKIIKTQNLSPDILKTLESSDNKREAAHALLAKEEREIVKAENLLIEVMDTDKAAAADLWLLRLVFCFMPVEVCAQKLYELAKENVPEAENAIAYYFMKYGNHELSEIQQHLEKSVKGGCLPAMFNLSQLYGMVLNTNPDEIYYKEELINKFYALSPPNVFGVFDMI